MVHNRFTFNPSMNDFKSCADINTVDIVCMEFWEWIFIFFHAFGRQVGEYIKPWIKKKEYISIDKWLIELNVFITNPIHACEWKIMRGWR